MLARPIAKQEEYSASTDGNSAVKSLMRAGLTSGNLADAFPGLFWFVPYAGLPRRGRNTVTSPNDPFRVLSASSACNTL